jgi:hypothetical protein
MLECRGSLTPCERGHPPYPPSKGDSSEDVQELCCRVTIRHRIYEQDDYADATSLEQAHPVYPCPIVVQDVECNALKRGR